MTFHSIPGLLKCFALLLFLRHLASTLIGLIIDAALDNCSFSLVYDAGRTLIDDRRSFVDSLAISPNWLTLRQIE